MMLKNVKTNTFHPIYYMEHPFPRGMDEDNKLIRYRSKGHRTIGFESRQDALDSIETELVANLARYDIHKELENDLEWNGEGIPADTQLRPR